MASTTSNGSSTQRKQLSDQLDRLDDILDGLAEALNESVADAVRDVVGQAVREAVAATLREVLSNPALLQATLALHGPPVAQPIHAQEAQQEPTFGQRLGAALQGGWEWTSALAAEGWAWLRWAA